MPLVSRDRLTARIGDAFGSIGSRQRFGEGDPFVPFAIGAIQGGIKVAQAIRRARQAPMSANLMTRQAAGSGTGHRAMQPVRGRLASSSRLVPSLPAAPRRRHRMRVTNVKALRRAMRRVTGFAKIARQTIGFTHRVKMKRRRRK